MKTYQKIGTTLAFLGALAIGQVNPSYADEIKEKPKLEESVSINLKEYTGRPLTKIERTYLTDLARSYNRAADDYEKMVAIVLPNIEFKAKFAVDAEGRTECAVTLNGADLLKDREKLMASEKGAKQLIKQIMQYNPRANLETDASLEVGKWTEIYVAPEQSRRYSKDTGEISSYLARTPMNGVIKDWGTRTPGSIELNLKSAEYRKMANEIRGLLTAYHPPSTQDKTEPERIKPKRKKILEPSKALEDL